MGWFRAPAGGLEATVPPSRLRGLLLRPHGGCRPRAGMSAGSSASRCAACWNKRGSGLGAAPPRRQNELKGLRKAHAPENVVKPGVPMETTHKRTPARAKASRVGRTSGYTCQASGSTNRVPETLEHGIEFPRRHGFPSTSPTNRRQASRE